MWSVFLLSLVGFAAVVLCSIVTLEDSYRNDGTEYLRGPPEDPKFVCVSEGCEAVATEILRHRKNDVNPCENPDEHICGGWREHFDLPDDETGWTLSFDNIANNTRHHIKNILEAHSCQAMKESLLHNITGGSFDAWDTMSTCVYESCMDTDALDYKGAAPLLDLLVKQEGPTSLHFLITGKFDEEAKVIGTDSLLKAEMLSNRLYAIVNHLKDLYFWGFWVGPHTLDSSKNQTLRIHGAGIGMAYHFYDDKHIDIQSQYRRHLVNLFQLFDDALIKYDGNLANLYFTQNPNRRDSNFTERVQRVYNFEMDLREILLSPEQSRDIIKYTNVITFAELKRGSPFIDVEKIINLFMKQVGKVVQDDQYEFLIHEKDYLERIGDKLQAADWGVIHDYFLLHTLDDYSYSLSKEWRDEYDRYSKERTGADPLPRWRRCRLSPPSWIVAKRYIEEGYDMRRKDITIQLVQDLKIAFGIMLKNYEWMTPETTEGALIKLEAIKEKIAYPEWLIDDHESYFTKYYGHAQIGLSMSDDYFSAKLYFRDKSIQYELSQFSEPQDFAQWLMTPQSVNAYYSPSMNEIAFMAAILDRPSVYVWKVGGSRVEEVVMRSLTYGGIGGIIGHEITHGFDDKGKHYDKDGKLDKWFSDVSEKNFQAKAKCVEDQYSDYSVSLPIEDDEGVLQNVTLNVRGSLTLGENIADNGGVHLSWNALRLKLSEEELDSCPLSYYGVDMTVRQLFMYAWGHFWCSVNRPKADRRRIETDAHSPDEFRVRGPLANFDEYAKSYNCADGTPMKPKNSCRVW